MREKYIEEIEKSIKDSDGEYEQKTMSFFLLMLLSPKCVGYKLLSEKLDDSNIEELISWTESEVFNGVQGNPISSKRCKDTKDLLIKLLNADVRLHNKLQEYGVTLKDIKGQKEKKPCLEDSKFVFKEQKKETWLKLDDVLTRIGNIEGVTPPSFRDNDIYKIFNTLSKPRRNNICLVGDYGVGKTAIVHLVANAIEATKLMKGELEIQNTYLLNDFISSFTAYKKLRENVISAAEEMGNCLFVVDDINEFFALTQRYPDFQYDLFFLELLNNENIHFMCTITNKGYKTFIENSNLFENKIEPIFIKEPNNDETLELLEQVEVEFETSSNIKTNKEVLKKCARLGRKAFKNISMPGSAISLMEMIYNWKIKQTIVPKDVEALEKKIMEREMDIILLSQENASKNIDEIDALKLEINNIKIELQKAKKRHKNKKEDIILTESDVNDAFKTSYFLRSLNLNDDVDDNLIYLEDNLNNNVFGQKEAINFVCRGIKRKKMGLSKNNKPNSFLFCGKTGCGKTFLAKNIAKFLYGNERQLVTFDMSEFADKTSVNKLYGSANGYIGYEDGGLLTEAIKKNPSCVLLFDEIEKAHKDVFNSLLQILDEGRMTDNHGVVVDFTDVVIILTSNVGVREAMDLTAGIGFGENKGAKTPKDVIEKTLKKTFNPEFINRLDGIIQFNDLSKEQIYQIAWKELDDIKERLIEKGYKVSKNFFADNFVEKLLEEHKYNEEYGAREIARIVEENVTDKIVDYLVNNNVKKNTTLNGKTIFKEAKEC